MPPVTLGGLAPQTYHPGEEVEVQAEVEDLLKGHHWDLKPGSKPLAGPADLVAVGGLPIIQSLRVYPGIHVHTCVHGSAPIGAHMFAHGCPCLCVPACEGSGRPAPGGPC